MKVLIAVDDSPYSEAVVESAVKRDWPEQTQFLILTVLEPIPLDTTNKEEQKEMRALIEEGTENRRKTAKALVETVSDRLKKLISGPVEFSVKEGSPKKEIVESAIEFGADRILIGAQGHGTCARNLLGEVSRVVAATAHCSVEIIRETVRP